MRCQNCSAGVSSRDKVCRECGAPLSPATQADHEVTRAPVHKPLRLVALLRAADYDRRLYKLLPQGAAEPDQDFIDRINREGADHLVRANQQRREHLVELNPQRQREPGED